MCSPAEFSTRRLCWIATLASLATVAMASFFPFGASLGELQSSRWVSVGWIAAQSLLLVLPGLLMGWLLVRFRDRVGLVLGSTMILAIPLIVLCDGVTFHWIAERFLSRAMLRVIRDLPHGLTGHVAASTWWLAIGLFVGFACFVGATWWLSGRLAQRWKWKPSRQLAVLVGLAVVLGTPGVWNLRTTIGDMNRNSARHPLMALRLMKHVTVGQRPHELVPQLGRASRMEAILQSLDQRQAALSVTGQREDLPDVVVVVIESMRPELVDSEVMPTLSSYAAKGLNCRKHFSAGNATNHGMFSLLSGLEATWYSRPVCDHPILNRLFREAGYEIGFFAGDDDWAEFRMDGFIHQEHFDRFHTEPRGWLESDRRCTELAATFLDEDRATRPPRLAILYLYSTHANYRSYPDDQVFQPAADDRFLIPYSIGEQPRVWNRYKNSARSADRFLAAVLRDDRVAVVTGDHGESFLEDGVCGHGVRVSQFQNMTPAVVYRPRQRAKAIDVPTMHADLLPTLLSAAGIEVSDAEVLDGVDLLRAQANLLRDRVVATRNYLSDDLAFVGAWTQYDSTAGLFGYRGVTSLTEWQAQVLNPINPMGNELNRGAVSAGETMDHERLSREIMGKWIADRFGVEAVASFGDSPIGR